MAPPASSSGVIQKFVNTLAGKLGSKDSGSNSMERIARLGMSPRQQELNYLWGVYKCVQYSGRKIDWSGKEIVDRMSSDLISTQGFIPPGFQSAGKDTLPLKFRKPTAPYALIRVIVDRFSGLLFSEQRHPEVNVDGDPATQDWLRALVEKTRLWQQMIQARAYGGATGTAVVGFQVLDGAPVIEVHDPRWCIPEFTEHGSTQLVSLEIRYIYPKEERDPATGKWGTKQYWYRRLIDQASDTVFAPAEVGDGAEPNWEVAKQVSHNFGFCPAVWIQNLPVLDAVDGDPDCPPPVYEMAEAVDTLISQAHRGVTAQCDPTLVLTTKAELGAGVRIGVENAIHLPDGDAKFLELQASGPKAAMEQAETLRKYTLEMAQCMLEHPDVAGKTATEVEGMYESMVAKADVLREQYGQRGIIPILEMFWRAAMALYQPRMLQQEAAAPQAVSDNPLDGIVQRATTVRQVITLPPKWETNELGQRIAIEHQLGEGGTISLKWPGYFQPSVADTTAAVTAAGSALQSRLIDDETAIKFVAPFFKVEDSADLVQKVRANAGQEQADMMAMQATAVNPEAVPPTGAEQPPDDFSSDAQDGMIPQ